MCKAASVIEDRKQLHRHVMLGNTVSRAASKA